MKINIEHEVKLLETNFLNQIEPYFNPELNHKNDKTFRSGNWIITFPYNYIQTKNDCSLELIRKLAVINAIYVFSFFREDDVLDEYHLSKNKYKQLLVEMCESRTFRNLAIGQLIHLCGSEIFDYIFEYEKKYYNALIFEKSMKNISLKNMFNKSNLLYLGYKVLPLYVTFTAYCLMENMKEKITLCEDLIVNYHIAHQLYDDIWDISEDLKKPDLSYTLKTFKKHLKKNEITARDIDYLMEQKDVKTKMINSARQYLHISKNYANELHFEYFLLKINDLEMKLKHKL